MLFQRETPRMRADQMEDAWTNAGWTASLWFSRTSFAGDPRRRLLQQADRTRHPKRAHLGLLLSLRSALRPGRSTGARSRLAALRSARKSEEIFPGLLTCSTSVAASRG